MANDSFEHLIESEIPILIDFYATWCGPCKAMLPALEEVAKALAGKVKIIKIDVDKNTDLAVAQKVMGVPTLMLYKKGALLWKEAGTQTATQLKAIIEPHL